MFTARSGKQMGVSVMHVGETAWSTVRSVDVDPKTAGSSLTCSASPVAAVGAAKATIAIGCPIAGTDRVQAAIIAYDGTVQKTFTMTLPSGSFPQVSCRARSPWRLMPRRTTSTRSRARYLAARPQAEWA